MPDGMPLGDSDRSAAAGRAGEGARCWSVLVADDEPLARVRLRSLLARHPAFEVVHECATGGEVLTVLEAQSVDVVFLDVRMPELDGVAVAQALADAGARGRPVPAIVFVTAFDVHAARAFDLDAIDYLVKPVDIDRFDRAMARLGERLPRVTSTSGATLDPLLRAALSTLAELRSPPRYPTRFPVRDARGVYFVSVRDIERVEAEGNYVALCAGGRRHLLRESMRGIEARLDPDCFVRVHRSAIVNIECIRRIEPWGHGEYLITMSDGTRLTSTRTNGDRVQALMR